MFELLWRILREWRRNFERCFKKEKVYLSTKKHIIQLFKARALLKIRISFMDNQKSKGAFEWAKRNRHDYCKKFFRSDNKEKKDNQKIAIFMAGSP